MIKIKTLPEIERMREGGRILAKATKELQKRVKPGIKTQELERFAENLILKLGAQCSFKGYKNKDDASENPYPACLCVSVNEEVVHFPPSERALEVGDIVSLDLGVFYRGFHTDMAVTVAVGRVDPIAKKLIKVTRESLEMAIKEAKPGKHFGDIGYVIQKHVEKNGFSVVRDLCGHGIGQELHEDPQILNYAQKGTGPEIKEGMVFCIEPITTAGDWRIKKSGIGYKAADNSLACHFEHTIAVTKKGNLVLTDLRNAF